MSVRDKLLERFLRYVAIESQSDMKATSLPSTPGQQVLAELLAEELRRLGPDRTYGRALTRGLRMVEIA